MAIDLYEQVALARDIGEHGLKPGDVATLVDVVPHPSGGPEGYVVEVFNAVGESIGVIVVAASDVEALRDDEVLSVRQLVGAVASPPQTDS